MTDLARIFDELVGALDAGGTVLLLSDYDGTLTPIVTEPADAWLGREVRDDLQVLAASKRVRVAVISGRRLEDLRMRVGLGEVIYAGCHGLEVEGPGFAFRHPAADASRAALRAVTHALRERTASMPGVRLEPKGLSVAFHYRSAPPGTAAAVAAALEEALDARGEELRVLRGKKVFEILPNVGWNKGRCALGILDHVRASVPGPLVTVYLGDDTTDELAFRALGGAAITVRVGGGFRSAASYRLRDVSEVHRLLSALAAEALMRERSP